MLKSLMIVLLFAVSAQTSAETTSDLSSVFKLREVLIQRLTVMPDVARYKWNNDIPVEDLEREARLLAVTVARAEEAGIEENFAANAVQAQMTASKLLQSNLIEGWRENNQEKFENVPDLVNDIRPKLVELTPRLLLALREAKPLLEACRGIAALVNSAETGVSADVWQAATDGLIMERCR